MPDERLQLPYQWRPRDHQLRLWQYSEAGGKRAVAVWHRRAGKDSTCINITAVKSQQRVGTYWHMLPEATQGRKVVWDAIDKQGRRVIDQAFPEDMRAGINSTEMKINLSNGSVWQVVGSDNYNSLVGSNPLGVVFSEFSIANPAAWDYMRPILRENGGWAIFIFTTRGKNHGYKLFKMAEKMAKADGSWFAELLTVDDTLLVTPEEIQRERDEGMDDDMVAQEYFCSWTGSTKGSIYGEQLRQARDEARIGKVPYVRSMAVNTFWDIGHSDSTAIVCHQRVGATDRFIDAYANSGEDMAHYAEWMQKTGYLFGKHYLPHDAKNITIASKNNPKGDNAYEQLIYAGVNPRDIVVVPRTPDVWAAIRSVRGEFGSYMFDEEKCEGLLNALGLYRKKWSDERQCFEDSPYHDWASNYADAFRQKAQGYQEGGAISSFTSPNEGKQPVVRRFSGLVKTTVGNKRLGY